MCVKRLLLLFLSTVLLLAGCQRMKTNDSPGKVPEDFSFALQWNVNGVSSYDSETGILFKTTDPERQYE